MARTLIVFGTTDGHTAKIAQVIGDHLRSHGHAARVVDISVSQPSPENFDAAVVLASIHAGGYQRAIVRWVKQHAGALNRMSSVFVSVCLGVLQHDPAVDRQLQAHIAALLRSTAWQPRETKVVAGALKYTKYNFLKRWVMKRIVRKAGGDTDTSKDYEYTDWNDLRRFSDALANRFTIDAQAKTA